MKNIIKRVAALVFCLALAIVSMCYTSFAANGQNDPTQETDFEKKVPLEVQEAMEKQIPALEEYFKLISRFEKDEFGIPKYPENYAGEYINSENKLVVHLTHEFSDAEILSYLKSVPIIKIEYVTNSYNELLSQRKIADNLYASGVHIVSDGIDIIDNIYRIEVLKEDLEIVQKTYSDNSLVLFEEGTYAQPLYSLTGGDKIYNEDTGSSMSMGICGTYNGNNAILTCGHGNEYLNWQQRYPYIQYKTLNHRIGQVVFQRANTDQYNYGLSSLGDFAIVSITSSDTMTNDVWVGGDIIGTYSSVPVGTIVYKFGYAAGYAWGSVTSTGMRRTYVGSNYTYYTVDGLYQIPVQNSSNTQAIDLGDSGGPVWRTYSGGNYLHGIVTCCSTDYSTMYTTPIYYPMYQGFQPKVN